VKLSSLIFSILAVLLSFAGGFLIANSFNRSELESLRAENDRLKANIAETTNKAAEFTLSDEEIKARIAEADSKPSNLKFNRDLGIGLYRYGVIKKDVAILSEAVRLLNRVNAADPKDVNAAVTLGHAHFDIATFGKEPARFKTAREIYTKALELKPRDADVLTDIALTYFLEEPPNLTAAATEFQKALAIDSKNERALQFYTQTLWQSGNTDEAAKSLAKLKEINSSNSAVAELEAMLLQSPPIK
jgi:tetratricopeptide (TPR) repeat protein